MNIVLANNRYFVSGGPERYMFSVKELLEYNGHSVVPFSVNYARNQPTRYAKYFVQPPGDSNQVVYEELKLSAQQKVRLALRSMYSTEARRALSRVLENEQIDVVYLLAVANMLSMSVVDACRDHHIPVIMRLSDFNFACASYLFYREGKICRDCTTNPLSAIRHRCVKGSAALSAIRVAGIALHRALGLYDKVSAFIAPSLLMKRELEEFGIPSDKIYHIPSVVQVDQFLPAYRTSGPLVYFGRISPEKGIETLIRAFASIKTSYSDQELLIIGSSFQGERERLQDIVDHLRVPGVAFIDQLDSSALRRVVSEAFCVVVPSVWSENTPMVIYESMAMGKPVVASDLPGMVEQIVNGETGLIFSPGDHRQLAEKLDMLLAHPERAQEMGRSGRSVAEAQYSPDMHYQRLLQVLQRVTHGDSPDTAAGVGPSSPIFQ